MTHLPIPPRSKLPLLIAGLLSFLFTVWLYFVQGQTTAGVFVALWVPSIAGGLFLTGRQLDEQPELVPETSRQRNADASFDRALALVRSGF
ncbi:MAG: hypothetical protein EA389_00220 [Ilumatobacter sp.]|nr:MAG: hypothetical protein EA389_00220 [Ilumatobacter sp.]